MISTTGGFTCIYCGAFVMWNQYHSCQPVFTTAPSPTYADPNTHKLDQIIELLKKILEELT